MAIYSSVPPPAQQSASSVAAIEAWSASALQSLHISPVARGTGVSLAIPLGRAGSDDDDDSEQDARHRSGEARRAPARARKELLRDSMKRRESLLKGKEGSRRRQRWENDRLLHVPNAQPPLPSDWTVQPTHKIQHVPYYLAPLWDAGVRHRAEEVAAAKHQATLERNHKDAASKPHIAGELRKKCKKSKGAKTLLQDLEEEVRRFVVEWEAGLRARTEDARGMSPPASVDSEDEEIVFVGRNGTMSDEVRDCVEEELEREKLIWESLADDRGASFGRWLVHSIAEYYGLTSRSITVGDPARREAYVGINLASGKRPVTPEKIELPRPLWCMV